MAEATIFKGCFSAMTGLAEGLKVAELVSSTFAFGLNVIHIRCCIHTARALTNGLSVKHELTKLSPLPTITTSCSASPRVDFDFWLIRRLVAGCFPRHIKVSI
jgi:hypothetical protein